MKTFIAFYAGIVVGVMLSIAVVATAHTPCNDYQPPPLCHYIQVVNPITGQLETEYVCE